MKSLIDILSEIGFVQAYDWPVSFKNKKGKKRKKKTVKGVKYSFVNADKV